VNRCLAALVVIAIAIAFASFRTPTDAQTPANSGTDELIGSWSLVEPHTPASSFLFQFGYDGNVAAVDGTGGVWMGVWLQTGERTYRFALEHLLPTGGAVEFAASIEIAPGGGSWNYVGVVPGPEIASAVRIEVDSDSPDSAPKLIVAASPTG
jgi:hypothetical protein